MHAAILVYSSDWPDFGKICKVKKIDKYIHRKSFLMKKKTP